MELGIIGLGKMGFNMAERLRLAGHKVVGFDFNKEATAKLTTTGSLGVDSLEDLVKNLSAPRAIWIMVPSGDPVDQTLAKLEPLMQKGDTFIDGGNSNYKDTQRRHAQMTAKGFEYVDCGTSGGVWGLKEGYSLMIGGDKAPVERLTPIFQALAPSHTEGWGHVGPSGAGHFVKMVHNGIEYGLMQAFAEGFSIMKAKEPLNLDLTQIAHIWQKALSCVPGCSISLLALSTRIQPSMVSKPGSPIPAKAAGPLPKPLTSISLRRSSPSLSSVASVLAKRTTSPTE